MTSLGLLGYGNLSKEVYGPVVRGLAPRAQLAGVVDVDTDRRQSAKQAFPSARTFSSLDDLLSATRVDGVLIATPPTTHANLAVTAFEAGCAVYVEKPLASEADAGMRILEAWKRCGSVGMVGFNYRFNPLVQELRFALADEEIGPVMAVRSCFGLATDELPGWKTQRSAGGGALLDLASHHVDLVTYLLGSPVETVACHISSRRSEDDSAALTLTLSSGVVVQMQVSLGWVEEDRIELYGRMGKLVYDRYCGERIERTGRSGRRLRRQLLANRLRSFIPGRSLREKLRSPWREPSFRRAISRFVEAIESGELTSPDLEDGWRCLRVILAAEAAHRTGRTQVIES